MVWSSTSAPYHCLANQNVILTHLFYYAQTRRTSVGSDHAFPESCVIPKFRRWPAGRLSPFTFQTSAHCKVLHFYKRFTLTQVFRFESFSLAPYILVVAWRDK